MAESNIEWTGHTWNPILGCSVVSPGCTNCYAMKLAARLDRMGVERYAGLTKPSKAGAVWTGEMRLVDDALTLPLRRKKPTTYFVNSMSDLFHEGVPEEWIAQVFAIMALTPQHTYQILTKRPARMRSIMYGPKDHSIWHPKLWHRSVLPNVWLGVSAEDQRRADERVPDLLATPAAVRFVSAEPLLGPIDFTNLDNTGDCRKEQRHGISALWKTTLRPRLDWIIVGGESGPNARPMHPQWAREIREQCAAAGVPFFFKQWGAWVHPAQIPPADRSDRHALVGRRRWVRQSDGAEHPQEPGRNAALVDRVGKHLAGRLLDGVEHNGMPGLGPVRSSGFAA